MRVSRAHGVLLLVAALVALTLWIAIRIDEAPAAEAPVSAAGPRADPGAAAETTSPAGSGRVSDEGPEAAGDPARAPVAGAEPQVLAAASRPDRIEGRVLKQDGRPAPAGITVIARRRGKVRVDPDVVARVLRGDPSIPSARSGVDGSFALEGLEPGAAYLLCAAGAGYVAKSTALEVRAGSSGAVVPVSRLYGVAVELRHADGTPLRTDADLAPPPPRTFGRADPFLDPSLLDLVGTDLAPHREGRGRKLLLFTAQADPPVLSDVRLRFHPAGYAPIETQLDVPPILPSIALKTLVAEPTAAGWGEVLVRFVDGSDPTLDAPIVRAFQLELASPDGSIQRFDIPRGPGEKRLHGIPFGAYAACVRNAIRQAVHPGPGAPATSIEVGPTAVAIDVSLAGLAAVEVLLDGPDGQPYAGPATLRLAPGHRTQDAGQARAFGGEMLFDRGPYVLGALLPGPYTLYLDDPQGTVAGAETSFAQLDLEAGAGARLRLLLP